MLPRDSADLYETGTAEVVIVAWSSQPADDRDDELELVDDDDREIDLLDDLDEWVVD